MRILTTLSISVFLLLCFFLYGCLLSNRSISSVLVAATVAAMPDGSIVADPSEREQAAAKVR
jgi:hypothetical protein